MCHLVASAAAWICSPTVTSTPRPAEAGWTTVRTAASRFAGPSHPGSETVLIAPQKATGLGPASVRSSR